MPEAVVVRVREALREAVRVLRDAGVETPSLDAELLLAEAMGVGRQRLLIEPDAPVGAFERFEAMVARRAAREPVAYILGRREFRRLSLAVDRRVLIPRPETELLVEAGLSLPSGARAVDVGTGSGALALALKDERPDLDVSGADVDPGAIEVARANAARLGLEVRFEVCDLLPDGRFDAVLANLPYVAKGASLPPEIALYEPPRALFGGPDGLDLVRRLTASLDDVPFVALEVGFDQAATVADLLSGAGLRRVERLRDLAGHERVLVGRR